MFSVVSNPINTSQKLNKNLDKVGLWANEWEMSFNPNSSKQTQVVIFFTEDNQSISIINSKGFGGYILMKSLHSNMILMKR